MSEHKQRDSERQALVEVFEVWWAKHRNKPVKATSLHEEVKSLLDPQGRGRWHLANRVGRLAGTRIAGFTLERQSAAGKWGAASYILRRTDEAWS